MCRTLRLWDHHYNLIATVPCCPKPTTTGHLTHIAIPGENPVADAIREDPVGIPNLYVTVDDDEGLRITGVVDRVDVESRRDDEHGQLHLTDLRMHRTDGAVDSLTPRGDQRPNERYMPMHAPSFPAFRHA